MTRHVDLGPFEFACGESIPNLRIAYETYGELREDSAERRSASGRAESSSNAVLLCHALTGSAHVSNAEDERPNEQEDGGTSGQAAAWWDDIVGPGKAIDTTEYFVVCANVPGSCYGTTGPASPGPDGEPYGSEFPAVTVGDWTRAQRRLLDELGVDRLHAVVGGSVGGMNALEWVKRYPSRVERVVPIATAARLDPQGLALDAVARRAITSDSNWNGGDYYGGDHPDEGLALARQIGHVMYLSKESMERKFGRRSAGRGVEAAILAPDDPGSEFFPYRDVESYLDYQAEKFVERFDANSYLSLVGAMDNYDLAAGAASDADALAGFDGEALLLSFTSDWHFTVEQADDLAHAFRDASIPTVHCAVESDHGHDAFLVEPGNVGPPLSAFLDGGVEGLRGADRAADGNQLPPRTELLGN